MYYEGLCPAEWFLYNLCPSFDTALAQLGVIPIIRNNFVEIVAVSEHYLIPNHVKNKESKKNPVKLSNGKILMKKEKKKIFVPNLQHCQFG